MPMRATKRGSLRTRLERDCDVLVCGASFAGLAVARELAGCGARVLVIDRYELGERQTSACAMPTLWMEALDVLGSLRQTSTSRASIHSVGIAHAEVWRSTCSARSARRSPSWSSTRLFGERLAERA